MTTPFEATVVDSFIQALHEASIPPELVDIIESSYSAEKLQSADSLLQLIKQHSGDKTA